MTRGYGRFQSAHGAVRDNGRRPPGLSEHERLMTSRWEASLWLDRREIVAESVSQPTGVWAHLVDAVKRCVFRMQLGPVGGHEI